jgi:hypothetical protein
LNAALVLAAAVAAAPVESPQRGACDGALAGVRAAYMMPTERYRHGALGDVREWGGLVYDGDFYAGVVLGPETVFEDVAPRVADFEGDCAPEIVTVETHETEGAQLVIWAADRGRLTRIAATPAPGRRFGFLAPLGVGDLTGDGAPDVALVVDPHGEGRLEVWTLAPGGLTRVAVAPGFSNHRFGDPEPAGGLRRCGAGVEMVLADAAWSRTLRARVEGGRIVADTAAPAASPDALARALDCP